MDSFTDDDLKRLKEFAECGDPTSHRVLSSEEMAALLVRLEAAENILNIGKRDLSNPKYDGYFESWRKAAGK